MVDLIYSLLKSPVIRIKNYFLLLRIVFLDKSIKLHISSTVEKSSFGSNIYIGSNSKVYGSSIGSNSYLGNNCSVSFSKIGKFCSIANDVIIGLGGIHPTNFVSTSPVLYKSKFHINTLSMIDYFDDSYPHTVIGNDVWLGRSVLIKEGVNIGDGAIVAAGAVVISDVEPYSIVGGVPAKLIKYRFPKTLVDQLVELKWWDLDEEILKSQLNYVNDPVAFIYNLSKK